MPTGYCTPPRDWGEHPIDKFRAQAHSDTAVMSTNEIMKVSFSQGTRSVLHHFLTTTLPFQPAPAARFKILGGVMVVSLSGAMLVAMRFLLAD